MNQTAYWNKKAANLLNAGDSQGAVRAVTAALAHMNAHATKQQGSKKKHEGGFPRSSSIRIKTGTVFLGIDNPVAMIEYFEQPFLITSVDSRVFTNEEVAYCSALCFYNLALAWYSEYKRSSFKFDRLQKAYDFFLRAFHLLSVCNLDPDDSKLVLLMAVCNNLAAVQADFGNLILLRHWGEKFNAVLQFADADRHWNDRNFHHFRMKHVLGVYSVNAAGAA
jgi:hypothetical protein